MQDCFSNIIAAVKTQFLTQLNSFHPKLRLSVIVLIAALSFLLLRFIFFSFCKKLKTKRILTGYQWLLIGVFASAFCLFIKVCPPSDGFFTKISQSAVDSLRLFTLELRLPELKEMIFSENKELVKLDTSAFELTLNTVKEVFNSENSEWRSEIYISFFALLAPLCTVIAAVSLLFNDWLVQLKYLFPIMRVYALSELNENSICLAKDIRKNHPFSMIIFTGVVKNDLENSSDDLLSQVKVISASITQKSITDFHFFLHAKPHIYLIDKEEKNNVKNGKVLYEKYRIKKIIINVFSTLKSAETFIDNIDKNNARAEINLIDPAQIIAYDLMAKNPMFKAADACGSDTMSVLVVGAGYIGMKCAKAAMWCGLMDSMGFRIRIIDRDDRESAFNFHVRDFKTNLLSVGCDINYEFCCADVSKPEFIQQLESYPEANYIIVSVGDDELTINTYRKIRQFYIRKAINNNCYDREKEPVIIPIIRGEVYNELLRESKNDKLYPAGCNSEVFKEKVIDEWLIEKSAYQIHKNYRKNDKTIPKYKNISQSQKRSSRACAVHSFYKLRDMGVYLELSKKPQIRSGRKEINAYALDDYLNRIADESNPDFKVKDSLPAVEHSRWCIFQLLDGWTGIDVEQIKRINNPDKDGKYFHKFIPAKMHASIVENSELDSIGLDLQKDKNYFNKNDRSVTDFVGSQMVKTIQKYLKKTKSKNKVHIYINEGENNELHS